jgi:lipopolysaccharide export system protein LptA
MKVLDFISAFWRALSVLNRNRNRNPNLNLNLNLRPASKQKIKIRSKIKSRTRALTYAAFCAMLCVCLPLFGQRPPGSSLQNNFQYAHYVDTPTGKVLEMIVSAREEHSGAGRDESVVTLFEVTSLRNGLTNLTAQGPECHVLPNSFWDAGHIEMFTPSTNVFVQGEGFYFSDSNHVMFISNNVETRILRTLLKSPMLGSQQTNAQPGASQTILIHSRRCQFDAGSNRAEYFGNVHVIDPQMDVTADYLFVQLSTNGGIENILARQNVVITTTNKGRATGAVARYYVAGTNAIMVLTEDAAWRNGDQEARAEQFTYDSSRHVLWATNHVRVRWPNATPTAAQRQAGESPRIGASGSRLLFSDDAMMQMPLTNGPVESMIANGNVIIVNQADQSRSTADHAVYSRTDDRFELTGSPVWWNDRVKIHGQSFVAEVTNQIYHARGDATFETAPGSNQWLVITSTNIDFQTNLAVFREDVAVRLSENGALRDSLDCDVLNVEMLRNEVATAIAHGHVRGKTAPDRAGTVKTIACETLTAHRSPTTLLMKDLEARDHAVITEFGLTTNAPQNRLTADLVTADFFATTNQIERAAAEGDVVLDQIKPTQSIHATSSRADYTATNDQVKLSGAPLATTDKFVISNADYLIWQPKTNRFGAFGWYKIVPVAPKIGHPSS